MKRIIVSGLAFYLCMSGWGLFLGSEPSILLQTLWMSGFVVLSLLVTYHSFFSERSMGFFPFVVLGVILLNGIIQLTGGERSALWPAYFLFVVLVAAFTPVWQSYATSLLILAIQAANLIRSGAWQSSRWYVYAGFALSLFGIAVAIAHILNRTRRETARVRDAHDKLVAHADALDPLTDSGTLASLANVKTSTVQAAQERESTFNGLIDMISRFVPAHTYALFLRERRDHDETFVLRAIRSESMHAVLPVSTELDPAVDKTYVEVCAQEKQPQYLSDISGMGVLPAKLGYYRQDSRNVPVRSFFAIPVIQDEKAIGVIAVDSLEPGAFSLEDQDTLGYFEPFFIQIIEKIQLVLNHQQEAEHFRYLHKISTDLNSSLKFGEIMGKVMPQIKEVVPFDFCACILKTEDEGKPRLVLAALHGYDAALAGSAFTFEDSAIIAHMYKQWQEGVITSYYSEDMGERGKDIGLFPFKELQRPIRSLYGRLLVAKDNCLGAFFLASLKPNAFTEYHRTYLLDTLMNQISLVAYNSLLFEHIEGLARTDGLTGLLNHRTFMEKLHEEYRRLDREPRPFSILLMDIDKFKNVNDTYGHPVGDIGIKAVARVLMESARGSDFVARYGGEEFAVGMVDTDIKGAMQMAERVRKSMEQTIVTKVGGKDLIVTLSIGVSNFPKDTMDKAELVSLADNALYQAKRSGRNRVCLSKDVKDENAGKTGEQNTAS